MATTHAPQLDEHGAEHRPGCHLPGWTSQTSSLRGWYILRCAACGTVRLTRSSR